MRSGLSGHLLVALLVLVGPPVWAQTHGPARPVGLDLPPTLNQLNQGDLGDTTLCGTDLTHTWRQSLSVSNRMADGEPLSFQQAPAILRPDHTGVVRLLDFAVLGDHPTLTFERQDGGAPSGVVTERWERTATTTVRGRLVSLFAPRWSGRTWAEHLRHERHGFDRPYVFWGRVHIPRDVPTSPGTPASTRSVYLRVGSTGIPRSLVSNLAPDVQYASHVVNLVVPGFGDSRVTGGSYDLDLASISNRFYEHFADRYDSIAFVAERSHVAEYGAFHRNVKNEVEGIGKPLLDQSYMYGSAGRLQSVEFYSQGQFATNAHSSHEIAHQWGDGFDWPLLAGITEAGWHPSSHTPLLYRGETLLGSVLAGSRRVGRPSRAVPSDADYVVERTSSPMRFHPLQLYRMGQLPVGDVPDVWVFVDQDQRLGQNGRTPAAGTPVAGQTNRVTIQGIVAHHGSRRGPRPTEWRRATVVVSQDSLLSQSEMDYWNFFAQRLEDPSRSGVVSFEGYPSFDALTEYRVDLQTDIVPARPASPASPASKDGLVQPLASLAIDSPSFGPGDWPGLEFDTPVPSYYRPATRVRLSGRITASAPDATDTILVRFWKSGGSDGDALRFWGTVNPDGRFTVDVDPTALQEGTYSVGVFLFWPDSGAQYPRGIMSPAFVRSSASTGS